MRLKTTAIQLSKFKLALFALAFLCSFTNFSQTNKFDYHISKFLEFKDKRDSSAVFHLMQAKANLAVDYEKGYKPGVLYYNLGYVDYEKGDFKGALENFFTAERNFTVSGDSCDLKKTFFNIGFVISALGNNVAAIKYYTKYNKITNCESTGTSKLLFYYDMGLLFSAIGQHQDALDQYTLALKQKNEIESDELNRLLVELAINYEKFSLGEIRQAIAGNTKILANPICLKYPEDLMYYGFSEMGTFYLELENFDSAEYCFKQAQSIPKTSYITIFKLMDLLNFSQLEIKTGELDKALKTTNEALTLAIEIGQDEKKRTAYAALVSIYEKKGEWKFAHQNAQILRGLEDSLKIEQTKFSYLINEIEQQSSSLLELEKKVEVSKMKLSQRNLILIFCVILILIGVLLLLTLSKSKKEQELLNKKLEASNMNRGKIIATLTHDIRSPLGDVENILDLMKMDVLSLDDKSTIIQTLGEKIARLKTNVDEILNWSIYQLKGGTTNKESTPIGLSVDKALSYVNPRVELKNIRIITDNLDRELCVNADPTHLEVIVRNVLSFEYLLKL